MIAKRADGKIPYLRMVAKAKSKYNRFSVQTAAILHLTIMGLKNKMKFSSRCLPAFLSTFLLLCLSSQVFASEIAQVFRPLSLDAAKQSAEKEGKFLLIDFTASWCGPCRKMEENTWSNPSVQKWLSENAVAIRLDVDKDTKEAELFRIKAMPSIIVLGPINASLEFDRIVGYRDSAEFLDWLNAVKRGETSVDLLKNSIAKMGDSLDQAQIDARLKLALALLEKKRFDESANEVIFLWQKIPHDDPRLGVNRISMLLGLISALSSNSESAKQRFVYLRDDAEKDKRYSDFIILNMALDQKDRTLSWFDKVKTTPNARDEFKSVRQALEFTLVRAQRWKDLIYLYQDPISEIKELENSETLKQPVSPTAAVFPQSPFETKAAIIYAAVLSSRRDSEAKKLASEILRYRDTEQMKKMLVRMAISANQPRKEQQKWADDDVELSYRLKQALETQSAAQQKKP